MTPLHEVRLFYDTFQKKFRAFPNFEAVVVAAEHSLNDLQSKIRDSNNQQNESKQSDTNNMDNRNLHDVQMHKVKKSDQCCTFRYQSCCYVS